MKPDGKRKARGESARTAPQHGSPWGTALAIASLAFLVLATFSPVLDFEFIRYDVREQLLEDPNIRGLSFENIRQILTTRRITSYYPVRTLTFALDYHFWELNPRGFKLTNLLLHLSSTLLVFWLLRRMMGVGDTPRTARWRLAISTFLAAVFGIHPVVVEPVAWIGGREELLMTLGALGCIHFHLTARARQALPGQQGVAAWHVGATVCCAAACFSNAVGVVIPALVLAWDLLQEKRPTQKQIIRGSAAMWVIAAVTFVLKLQDPNVGHLGPGESLSINRVMLVPTVFWLNVKSLAWPTGLTVRYPQIEPESFLDSGVLLGVSVAIAIASLLWVCRHQRRVQFGFLWMLLAMLPSAQIMPHHLPRADRFLYLPLVGLLIVAAVGLCNLTAAKLRGLTPVLATCGITLLVLMQVTSSRQLETWRNEIAMWRQCADHNPHDPRVHSALAHSLNRVEQFEEAHASYERALAEDPEDVETLKYFALFLSECPDQRFLDHPRAVDLIERASQLRSDPLMAVVLAEVYTNVGQPAKAIETINQAISMAESVGNLMLAAQLMEVREEVRERPANE